MCPQATACVVQKTSGAIGPVDANTAVGDSTTERFGGLMLFSSALIFPLIFIYTPDRNVYIHSTLVLYKVLSLLVFLTTSVTASDTRISTAELIVCYCFSVSCVVLIVGYPI